MPPADADIEELGRVLRTQYACHAVIAYGSHARGDATPQSDYDLAGFGAVDRERRITGKWRGTWLDVFIHPSARLETADAAWLLMMLLEDWFQLRGRWYEGPKAALAWLASHERETHDAFAQALRPGAPLSDIARLVEVAVGKPGSALDFHSAKIEA